MPMGNGLDENNVLGPLQNKSQYDSVVTLVDAARESGARVLLGRNSDANQPGYFYPNSVCHNIQDCQGRTHCCTSWCRSTPQS